MLFRQVDRNPISVVRPGDINFSVIFRVRVDFSNINLESYVISFDIPRGQERNLGHKFPISRKVDFTAPVTIDIAGTVEKMSSGSLIDIVNLNQTIILLLLWACPKLVTVGRLRSNPCRSFFGRKKMTLLNILLTKQSLIVLHTILQ